MPHEFTRKEKRKWTKEHTEYRKELLRMNLREKIHENTVQKTLAGKRKCRMNLG